MVNREVIDGYLAWKEAAKECAASKQRLIEWYNQK